MFIKLKLSLKLQYKLFNNQIRFSILLGIAMNPYFLSYGSNPVVDPALIDDGWIKTKEY